jgi:serine/threonine protein kinase
MVIVLVVVVEGMSQEELAVLDVTLLVCDQVAVKTLKVPRGGEALQQEADLLCTLNHPHVVRIFGYCKCVVLSALCRPHCTVSVMLLLTGVFSCAWMVSACVPTRTPVLAIVMEFVAWGNLARWAASRRGELSEDVTQQRVRIANGVASGMAFIHSQGFVSVPV